MSDAPAPIEVESLIARDLAKKAVIAAPLFIVGIGAWRGVDAGAAVALAFAVVVVNFLGSAAVLAWTARRTPELLMGVAMMSFLGRLVLITAIGAGIKALDIVDWPVFCITLVVGYLGLLFWEMRSISLSLASPGLKPRPSTHAGVNR